MATSKTVRAKTPKTLKIKSKREKAQTKKRTVKSRKRLVVKTVKFTKMLGRARKLSRKAIRTAIKGTELKRIPEKLYRKIDTALAKNADFQNAIQAAVVAGVNELMSPTKKTRTPKEPKAPRVKKAKKEVVADQPTE
jgi:hypothetical protein